MKELNYYFALHFINCNKYIAKRIYKKRFEERSEINLSTGLIIEISDLQVMDHLPFAELKPIIASKLPDVPEKP